MDGQISYDSTVRAMSWSSHVQSIYRPPSKANSTLGFILRNLRRCPAKLKESAYISFVRSTLEYAASVWDPHLAKDINKLENIQRRPARFVNPLMGILKAQSNGPLYSNTVIGTLAVDGWTVTLILVQRVGAWADCGPAPVLFWLYQT